jgi:type VI secretion system protein ImpJ
MFLRPHHFQAFAAQVQTHLADARQGVGPYRWGVRRMEIDPGQLQVFQLSIHAFDVLLPDGTRICAPGNARLDARLFQEDFDNSRGNLVVRLGIPVVPTGAAAVADETNPRGRFVVVEEQRTDENTGTEEQPILRRAFNARLFFGEEDTSGYETVPIARLQRKSELDPEPVLDESYVPPLLEIGAEESLKRRLFEIADGLRAANEGLAKGLGRGPLSTALETGKDPTNLLKLHTTNGLLPVVEQTCLSPAVHPFDAYRVLCGLAGSLSLFREDKACPKLPVYDHEDIGGRFDAVIELIRKHLKFVDKREYDRRSFENHALDTYRQDCSFPRDWLAPGQEVYLGVESELEVEQVDAIVLQRLKVAAPPDIPNVVGAVMRGVVVDRVPRTPVGLPDLTNVHYFLVDRKTTDPERWKYVVEAEALSLIGNASATKPVKFHLYSTVG